MEILLDPSYTVVPVPPASLGVAWLRSHVARFSEGGDHARRRRLAEELLAGIEPSSLRRPGHPTANLAEALGLRPTIVDQVDAIAACYQPHEPITPEADEAVAHLVELCGGAWDEATAARIGLLIQAHSAVNALADGHEPPVPTTRRIGPDGEEVLIDLADAPFGAGRHACPGREHALALAEGSATG